MIIHNIKVAVRNLMKYKLQTAISVLSIAVGIVTLALAQSLMSRYTFPAVFEEPYIDRVYEVSFKTKQNEDAVITKEMLTALKGNGGLRHTEIFTVPNSSGSGKNVTFHLGDSSEIRKGSIMASAVDPGYPDFAAYRSAVSDKKIGRLKAGQAIISEKLAKQVFGDLNPIGVSGIVSDILSDQSYPITIVDIVKPRSRNELLMPFEQLDFCVSDDIEESYSPYLYHSYTVNLVLKEGSSKKQLEKEIADRLIPLGMEAQLTKVRDKEEYRLIMPVRLLVFSIAALILLSAVIGFLKIEIQLFRIRRREMTLRKVNGACNRHIFSCLLIELLIIIILSIILSLILGSLIQDFADEKLDLAMEQSRLNISELWKYSLIIGGVLIVASTLIAWLSIMRIHYVRNNLNSEIRRKGNHLFRNILLGIQISTCIIFVCTTFIILKGGSLMLKACNVPTNDSQCAEWLTTCLSLANHPEQLEEEIKRLPELETMIGCSKFNASINDISRNPEYSERLKGKSFYRFYTPEDTTLLKYLDIDVEWLPGNVYKGKCLLIGEKLYDKFKEIGLLERGGLSVGHYDEFMPIAGIIRKFPYDKTGEIIIAIGTKFTPVYNYSILIPKTGKGKSLAESVAETVRRVEPENITPLIAQYREQEDTLPSIVESAEGTGLILGGISIIICLMGIYSTISLETKARRKEMAIRKVNGAKGRDIYRLFGRVYGLIIIVSLAISIPVCFTVSRWVQNYINDELPDPIKLLPSGPIVAGCLIVIVLIFLVVYGQIHRMMQTDPAKIIAKE